jgi:hypothetical protein
MDLMDMASEHLTIRLPVCTHPMVGHSMVLSLEQGVVASRGVEAVAEYSVAGEGSVVGGGNAWGLDGTSGDWISNPYKPSP